MKLTVLYNFLNAFPFLFFLISHALLLKVLNYIYIETEETIMIHNYHHSFVNLCILLKTGGEPEKQLELQMNEVLVKCKFLGYRCFPGVWKRNGLVEVVTGKLISREWKFSLLFVTE